MKKFIVVAMVLTLGGVAYGSSIGVPWFVDFADPATKVPPITGGITGLVYLNNGTAADITCSIAYYNPAGVFVGPFSPENTFVVNAGASIGFRPGKSDPNTVAGGQEDVNSGWLVPDRPTDFVIPGSTTGPDTQLWGSLRIEWAGASSDITGMYSQFQHVGGGIHEGKVMSFAHLLPTGGG